MEKNLDSPLMRPQCEAELIEGLTSPSSQTQKPPNDALASSFDGNKPVKAMALLKVGKFLGSGAFGRVYHAIRTDESTQPALALKKSRTSMRVKRPPLKHEARVLQLLGGHPAIPSVYGYGRFRHFEYLAMELLASSLEDLHKDHALPLKAVFFIANQMVKWISPILFSDNRLNVT